MRGSDAELDKDSWFFFENLDSPYVKDVVFEQPRHYLHELFMTVLIELIDGHIEAKAEHDSISGAGQEHESAIWLNPELQDVLNIVISVLTAIAASWDSPCTCRFVPSSRLHILPLFIYDRVTSLAGVFDRNQSARVSS